MDTSVDSYIAAQPETVLSKDDYWQDYKSSFYDGKATKAPEHYGDLNYKIAKFFGSGAENSFESAYEAYLNNLNNENEFKATQSARVYDRLMDDTKYQRMMKDFEAAGLNPYLLVNNGGVSASAAPSSSKGSYKATNSSVENRENKTRNMALLFLALAKVAAALL